MNKKIVTILLVIAIVLGLGIAVDASHLKLGKKAIEVIIAGEAIKDATDALNKAIQTGQDTEIEVERVKSALGTYARAIEMYDDKLDEITESIREAERKLSEADIPQWEKDYYQDKLIRALGTKRTIELKEVQAIRSNNR